LPGWGGEEGFGALLWWTYAVEFVVFVLVAIVVSGIMIATYVTVTRISTKNHEIVPRRMRLFGVSLFVLFALTFHTYAIQAIGTWFTSGPLPWQFWMANPVWIAFWGYAQLFSVIPWYTPRMLGVFLAYRLLRAEIRDYDFEEVRSLGFMLLALCIIDISWRFVWQYALYPRDFSDQAYFALVMNAFYFSYVLLDFAVLAFYAIGGWKSWRRANQVLDGTYGNW
jgi:hypothetical protein